MKKLSLILAIVMAFCAMPMFVFAADTATASISSTEVKAGDEFVLTLSIKNSPGIAGTQFYIGYDANVMSYVSAKAVDGNFFAAFSPEAGANPVKVVTANLSLNNITGDITVAEITFKANDKAKAGEYDVNLSSVEVYSAPVNPETNEKEIVGIPVAVVNGTVTVKGSTSTSAGTVHKHSYKSTVVAPEGANPGYTLYECNCGHSYKGDYTYGDSPAVPQSTEVKLTIGSTTAYINGVAQTLDAAPINRNNRTMLPVRFLANAFGVDNDGIKWDGATRTATLTNSEVTIVVTIDAPTMTVNGESVALDSPAIIENDRTYLPVRAIANALGVSNDNIAWDAATNTATLVK